MNAALLTGFLGRYGSVVPSAPVTHSGWRYADSIDAAEIPNANVGDYIIDGPNIVSERASGSFRAIDMRQSFGNNNVPLGPGKKLIIKGGQYNYIHIQCPWMVGEAGNPVVITNYDGQLRSGGLLSSNANEHTFAITGPQYFKVTGKYDAVAKTGDYRYLGHDGGYAFSQGKYGIMCSMNWLTNEQYNFAIGGSNEITDSPNKMANNFEMEYIEVCDGGFGIGLKWDNPTSYGMQYNIPMTYKVHDCYFHDLGGEGGYYGQNTNNGSHKMVNCEVYNNRYIRVGNEGLQMGNYGEGCHVHNNDFIHCAIRWKSPFTNFQDRGIQQDTRQGEVIFENNLVLGVGEYFMVLSNANGINTPPDTPMPGSNIIVRNNVFFGTRYEGLYIFSVNDGITGFTFEDNWIAHFLKSTAPANIRYTAVYPNKAPQATRVVDNDNTDVPIVFRRNRYEAGLTFVDGVTPNVTMGVGADANIEVSNPVWPQFVNAGFDPGYSYLGLSMWSAAIGEDMRFNGAGTNKGQPNVYNFGDWTIHKSVLYKSLQNNNAGHEPQGVTDFWWEVQLFEGGTRPPDDYRLSASDFYNFLGVGLLDNETPGTQEVPIDLYDWSFLKFEPEIFDPMEIHIAAYDPGTAKVGLKIDYPTNILTGSPRIVGLGSSTMNGAGASTYAQSLPGLLGTWVANNTVGGMFIEQAEGGKWSGVFMPDGENAASDWNLNIEAALALDPDIIILSLPSNDPSFNTNEQFLANLQRIFDKCWERNVYCFVTTTQPRVEYNQSLQQMLYDAAALIRDRFKRFAVEVFTPLADPYTVQFPANTKAEYRAGTDTIHVNNAGHQVIFNAVLSTMQAYFENKGYIKYQIERSTSPTTGFTLYRDNVGANDVQLDREDGTLYYYRVRAQRANLSYTAYSNVVSLQQENYAGEVIQTVQIDFANVERPGPNQGWNALVPAGNVPTAGQEFENMLDISGNNSGISVEITGAFGGIRNSGGTGGPVFPVDVIRSSWRGDNTNKPALKFHGLDPAFLYTFRFLSSHVGSPPLWFTGYVIGDRGAFVAANGAVGDTANLLGIQPEPDGTVTVKVKALPAATIAFVNAVIIQKLNQNNAIPLDLERVGFLKLEPIVLLGGTTEGTVQINFTAPIDTDLPDWNEINVTTAFQDLTREDQVNTSMGVRFIGVDTNRTDNGSSYGGTPEYPASVMRYGIYRSGNPPLSIILTNINPAYRVDLEILCSRPIDNVQSVTVGGVTKEVNINNNFDRFITFEDVQPDVNGEITITTAYVSGPSVGYAYVTAMKATIREQDASLPIPIDLYDVSFLKFEPEVEQQNVILDLYSVSFLKFEPIVSEQGGNAAILSTNQVYIAGTSERAMIYQPAGYNGNNNAYPLMIYLHGAGRTISTILGEGVPFMLNAGDTLDGEFLVIAPGGPAGMDSWGQLIAGQQRAKHAFDYMSANYRVDPTQVYVTGLSLGAAGSFLFAQAHPTIPAAILAYSGSQSMTFPWATLENIAVWSQHGSTDSQQDRTNTPRVGRGINALNPPAKYVPLMSIYWGVGHSAAVWHDNGYRRKDSPVSGTKAKYNYNKWLLKFSKNAEREAYGHVTYAEGTLLIEDYLQAVPVVNALPASTFKTGLLGQLANLRALLFSRLFVVDLGSATYPSAAPVNNITNINNGQAIAVAEYYGAASTVGLTIVNRFSTFQPQTDFPTIATYNKYFGLDRNLSRDGARLLTSISTGSMKFTGLNNAKQYKVVVLHSMDNNDDFATQATLSVTIGAVTQTQYSQFNTFYTLVFDNVVPTAGEINIAARCAATRDTCITGLILIEKP